MKFDDWQEMYEQAKLIVDELDPILEKQPPHLAMLALAIEFASFKIGTSRIDADIICEMVHDVCRIRDVSDAQSKPS